MQFILQTENAFFQSKLKQSVKSATGEGVYSENCRIVLIIFRCNSPEDVWLSLLITLICAHVQW